MLRMGGRPTEADAQLRKGREFFQYDQQLQTAITTAVHGAVEVHGQPVYVSTQAAKTH